MKLKKLLAASTAALLALSSMAVSSVSAMAADSSASGSQTPAATVDKHEIYEFEAGAIGNWTNITINKDKFTSAAENQKLVIVCSPRAGASESKLSTKNPTGSWPVLNGTEDRDITAADTTTEITLTATAVEELKSNGLAISGSEISVKTVTLDGSTIFDSATEKGENMSWRDINIASAAQLAEWGVTKDNIADCSVTLNFGEEPSNGFVAILTKIEHEGELVDAQIAASNSDLSGVTSKEYKFNNIAYSWVAAAEAVKDATECPTANGLSIKLNDVCVKSIVFTCPAKSTGGDTEGGDKDPGNTETKTELWSGSEALGNWDNNDVVVASNKFADVKAGDQILVTYENAEEGAQFALQSMSDWDNLSEATGIDITTDSANPAVFTLTDTEIAKLKEADLIVKGKLVTITKIELISTSGGTTKPEDPDETQAISVKLTKNSWTEDGVEKSNWQGQYSITLPGVTSGTSTVEDVVKAIKTLDISVDLVSVTNSANEEVTVDKVEGSFLLTTGAPGWSWCTTNAVVKDGKFTVSVADVSEMLKSASGSIDKVALNFALPYEESKDTATLKIKNVKIVLNGEEVVTPGGDDNKPGGDDNKPGGDDNKPGGDDNKPGSDDNKPGEPVGEVTSPNSGSSSDNKPSDDKNNVKFEDGNNKTGIEISAPADAFDNASDVTFNAAPVADETKDGKYTFDLSFTDKDGKEIQPKSSVTVKIPVPEALKGKTVYVYHIEDDGKYTEISCKVENGMVVFTASKFSKYVISETKLNASGAPAESDNSGSTNPGTNPDTGVAALSLLPVAVAAAGIVVFKKRK